MAEEMSRIMVIGAAGQVGSELVPELRKKYGNENVLAIIHHREPPEDVKNSGPMEKLDARDYDALMRVVKEYDIDAIFHLASLLSAVGEQKPDLAWDVNMNGLKNVLDVARERNIKVFWPSSIAAFGPHTPRDNTPQYTIMDPNTMYGVTKVAGELLCNYYFEKFGVDTRSLRYPGLISWKTPPGGGTTDYAVEIFYEALKNKRYTSFLKEDAVLPMMYMPDAIKATIDIMEAPSESIKVRTSYNVTAISFAPRDIAEEIKKRIPEFEIEYKPDFRQQIAESWPRTIDDSKAREDWGWQHEYTLDKMVDDMMTNLAKKLGVDI